MSAYNLLELTLRDILRVIDLSAEDRLVRDHLIRELQVVVQSVASLRGSTVVPFGSFVSNLSTKRGDLDISVDNGSCKDKLGLLRAISSALTKRDGWGKFQLIDHGRVRILKFESNYGNISCDISINNLIGQMKSKLLFLINGIDGRFRDMVLLVKEWAHAHNIKSGTFNSYCLTLLVIFHFQTCSPAILPPLKEIFPRKMAEDLRGARADPEKHIEVCARNINRFRSNSSRSINRSSLSDLFISFMEKFRDLSSKATEQGIRPYSGRWEDLESKWSQAIFVEDPFDQPVNCTVAVTFQDLTNITAAFEKTHSFLLLRTQNRNQLVANLVTEEVFGLVKCKL